MMRLIPWLCLFLLSCGCAAELPPTTLLNSQTATGLGAAQGVTAHQGKIYLFGDAHTGVLKEYRLLTGKHPRLQETGRSANLTVAGQDRINHPTGLAIPPTHLGPNAPVFLGNSVTRTKQGRIFTLNLERLLNDGWADRAIENETLDDLAIQGSRPEYIHYRGRWLVATSDYGPGPNFIRIYDPAKLRTAARTSDPGVLVAKLPCGPWVQSLHWHPPSQKLILVQNQIPGLLWRLSLVDLTPPPQPQSPPPPTKVINIPTPQDELEGFAILTPNLGLYITSSKSNNITFSTH